MKNRIIVVFYDDPELHRFFLSKGKAKLIHLSDETQKILASSGEKEIKFIIPADSDWPKSEDLKKERDFLFEILNLFKNHSTIIVLISHDKEKQFLEYIVRHIEGVYNDLCLQSPADAILADAGKYKFSLTPDRFKPEKSQKRNIFKLKNVSDNDIPDFVPVPYFNNEGGADPMVFKINGN